MSEAQFWPVIAIVALGTWLVRSSFLALLTGRRLPRPLQELLGFIPAAALAALVAPAILMHGGELAVSSAEPRLFAGLAALAVGLWRRDLLAVLGVGMGALWLLRWLLG